MLLRSLKDLPKKYLCLVCTKTKPIVEMILVRNKKEHTFTLRPRCKSCHNKNERGHRRKWKTKYLRKWREYNSELNESYWRARNQEKRQELTAQARVRFRKYHHALLIQGRLRRLLDMHVSLAEARRLLKQFGPCYPSRLGLTAWGLRECARIRSALRRRGEHPSLVEIRMMVYADGHYIKPNRQKIPYQHSAQKLRDYWTARKATPATAVSQKTRFV
jgi:hypothetical protein